jgi:hypothetical protein
MRAPSDWAPPDHFVRPGGAFRWGSQVLPGGTSHIGRDDVSSMPVQAPTCTVVAHRRAGISMRGRFLDITERHGGVETGRERCSNHAEYPQRSGAPRATLRVGAYGYGSARRVTGPGQERPPVGDCAAGRPRPWAGGASACRVAHVRTGGRGNVCLRAGCIRCNESSRLPAQARVVTNDAEARASLADAAPAGHRSPGPPMIHQMQPAARGCIAMPAGATMMHTMQRHQPHHRCVSSRLSMKPQVIAAARRPRQPRAPQGRTPRRRQRVFTQPAECCI